MQGRLRAAHKHALSIRIETQELLNKPDMARVKATVGVVMDKGGPEMFYAGHGEAKQDNEKQGGPNYISLAETQAIAHALYHASFGEMECAEDK